MPVNRDRVYLAGPMFSSGDKAQQTALADVLQKNFGVHLPQRDGIEVASVMELLNDPKLHGVAMLESPLIDRCVTWVTRTVIALDIFQSVEGCQCVVVNLDGRVPDEGSLVEATVAWYAGRPVVPFKTTPITELGINSNPMVDAITRWAPPVSDVADIPNAVKAALAERPDIDLALVPPEVKDLCQLGRMVWEIRKRGALTAKDVTNAVNQLSGAPAAIRSIIEPVPLLQPRAFTLAIAIIELSKLGVVDPRRETIIKKLVRDLKVWSKKPGVRSAILNNPSTA